MVQWLALASQLEGPEPRCSARLLRLPPTIHVSGGRFTGHFKLPVDVNVNVPGCLSLHIM